jgi:membrane protease YdiL (CAAX protease family)
MVGKNIYLWSVALAAVFFFVMFSPWTAPYVNFWYTMTATAIILTSISLYSCRETIKELSNHSMKAWLWWILGGFLIAFVLWWAFWIGDKVSAWLFGFARPQVELIYGMKSGTSPVVIALLLLFIIGPGEELFWRAFLQRRLMQRWGKNMGFIAATACYTLVHIWSFNFMLVMAALVAGCCWGFLYRLSPRLLPALIISHAVWDVCAFILFPI